MDRNLVDAHGALGLGDPKRWLLTTSAAALVFAAAPAFAQDDLDTAVPDSAQTQIEEDDEIVVTGIRAALQAARDLKRNADTAVDSITASDVSALPDLSVSEALARVPGVVVQRVELGNAGGNPGGSAGDFPSPEGGGNLVRGLTLVRSEFNGRDAFSANGGRALDFGTVPPELIGAVDVYKNTSADLIEGGIGGSINLRTLEPFDRDGFVGVVTLDGTYTDLRDEVTPDFSALLSNRWDTASGEFGLLGSFSTSELKSDLNGFQVGPLLPVSIPERNGATRIAVPGGFQLRTNEVDRERDSYYLAGQYQNDDRSLKLTGKYSRIENEVNGNERTLEWFPDGEDFAPADTDNDGLFDTLTGDSNTNLIDPFTFSPFSSNLPSCNGANDRNPELALCETTFPVTGLYETGVISNNLRDWINARGANFTNLAIRQRETSMTDDLSLNAKWRPTDRLFVNLDAHRTTAESTLERLWGGSRFFSNFSIVPDLDNPQVTLVPQANNNPERRLENGNNEGAWSGAAPLGSELNDPANSFLLFNADEFNDNEGELWAIRGDVEYEFDNDGWFDAVKFGARYSDREQTNRQSGLNWASVAPPWNGGYLPLGETGNPNLYEEVSFTDFFRGGVVNGANQSFLFVNSDLLGDYDAYLAAIGDVNRIGTGSENPTEPDFVDGDLVFGDWEPLRQNGETEYGRTGNIDTVREEVINLYGRLDFGQEFDNGMSIDANVGLRYTKSDVSGAGVLNYIAPIPELDQQDTNGNAPVPENERIAFFLPETVAYLGQPNEDRSGDFSSDDRFLPSVNIKLNLNDNNLIRFGYSENISRPNIAQLRPGRRRNGSFLRILEEPDPDAVIDPTVEPPRLRTIDIQPTQIIETGGNPDLKPVEATNFDLSWESYWGDENSFTVGAFYKDIRNNIIFEAQTIDTVTLDGQEIPIVYIGDLNQDEATIQGVEVSYQQFYDMLPGFLSNLGLQANYTYIDAETSSPVAALDAQFDGNPNGFERIFRYGVANFPGLSEHTANVVGIYQSDVVEFRLAYNWRSEYLSSYRDFVTGNPIFQTDRGYLDGSLKYDVTDNMQFRVQVANILDTKAKAEQQIDAEGQRFGRTSFVGDRRVKFGVRYQF